MKRLLPLLLLCACAGSLVDHDGASSLPAGGGQPPTQACVETCTTTTVPNAQPFCDGANCTYKCNPGLLKTPAGCSAVSAVAAGGDHTCVIAGGQIFCWGSNTHRELGVETPPFTGAPVSPALPGQDALGPADQIAASTTQTCAHFTGGAVWCWGAGRAPQQIAGIPAPTTATVNAIAVGDAHGCAATDSAVLCWGDNGSGQLGSTAHADAQPVSGVPGAKVMAAGRLHTCAGSGSQLYCWGANDRGQDGNGTTTSPGLPALVQGAGALFVGAGEQHSCSGSGNGALSCWGANLSGQIDKSSLQDQTRPKGVASNASAMAGGVGHTCAIESGGAVFCWGLNDAGQLGVGNTSLDTIPLGPSRTALPERANKIAAGTKHTCALVDDGALGVLKCWGSNEFGQLGSGSAGGKSPTPAVAIP